MIIGTTAPTTPHNALPNQPTNTPELPSFDTPVPANAGAIETHINHEWGITLEPHPEMHDTDQLTQRLDQLMQQTKELELNLADILAYPADQFDKKYKEVTTNRSKHPFAYQELHQARTNLHNRKMHTVRTDSYFNHIVAQLDTTTATNNFVEAVQQLGHTAYSHTAAASTNPQAFATMMKEGTKLHLLTKLLHQGDRNATTIAALYAETTNLPPLRGNQKRGQTVDRNYSDQDAQIHKHVRNGLKQARNTELFLISAALGIYPHTTLDTAQNKATINQRALYNANNIAKIEVTLRDGNTTMLNL